MQRNAVSLYEVITSSGTGRAFGITFHSRDTAQQYAERMQAAGYAVDPWPEFLTANSLQSALEQAAEYYDDARLTATH